MSDELTMVSSSTGLDVRYNVVTGTVATWSGSMTSSVQESDVRIENPRPLRLSRLSNPTLNPKVPKVLGNGYEDRLARKWHEVWRAAPQSLPIPPPDVSRGVTEKALRRLRLWNRWTRLHSTSRGSYVELMERLRREHNEAFRGKDEVHYAMAHAFDDVGTWRKPEFRKFVREMKIIGSQYEWEWRERHRPNGGFLVVKTPRVTMRSVYDSTRAKDMGYYCIEISLKGHDVRVSKGRENLTLGSFCHPHVHTNGSPCLGTGQAPFYRAMKSGNISDAVEIVLHMLQHYDHQGAYQTMNSHWRREPVLPPVPQHPRPERVRPVEGPVTAHRCYYCSAILFTAEAEEQCSTCGGLVCFMHSNIMQNGSRACTACSIYSSYLGYAIPAVEAVRVEPYGWARHSELVQYRPYRRRNSVRVPAREVATCPRCHRQHCARLDGRIHVCPQRYRNRPISEEGNSESTVQAAGSVSGSDEGTALGNAVVAEDGGSIVSCTATSPTFRPRLSLRARLSPRPGEGGVIPAEDDLPF